MADGFLSGLARRAYDARETAEDYGRDAGRRLRKTAEDYGSDAGRRLREGGDDTRGELRRLWSQMEDLVERNLGSSPSEAARAAGDYARDGRELAYDVADQVRSVTRERPFVAIGIAVAATLIITSLLSSGKRR